MEFDTTSPSADQQQILAAEKKVTIQPINTNIVRDDAVEAPTAVELRGNVDSDIENTSSIESLVHPSGDDGQKIESFHHSHLKNVMVVSGFLCLGVLAGFAYFLVLG